MAKEAIKIQEGGVIDYAATAAVSNGDVVPLEERIGVALGDAVVGEVISLAIEGVFEINAKTSDVFAVGSVVYFDPANREITTVSTSMTPAGISTTVKSAGTAGTVNVKIG